MIIVIVGVEHWEICERYERLNIGFMLIECLLIRNDNISNCFTMSVMAK